VIAVSSVTFSAAPFFKAQDTPVIGVAQDASEWQTDTNMFSVYGIPTDESGEHDSGAVLEEPGSHQPGLDRLRHLAVVGGGRRRGGCLGSARGIKVGYVNAAFPFGSTNVAPIALAMKAAGINGFTAATDPNTAYALLAALKNLGVHLKAVLLYTGYGRDVTNQASPAEQQAAQGVSFENPYEVMEQNTPATKQFAADLKSAGIKGLPTQSEYNGYESVGMLLQGLKAAGKTRRRRRSSPPSPRSTTGTRSECGAVARWT
jgi:branched-chain amino acid transport system substrate-binding protein